MTAEYIYTERQQRLSRQRMLILWYNEMGLQVFWQIGSSTSLQYIHGLSHRRTEAAGYYTNLIPNYQTLLCQIQNNRNFVTLIIIEISVSTTVTRILFNTRNFIRRSGQLYSGIATCYGLDGPGFEPW